MSKLTYEDKINIYINKKNGMSEKEHHSKHYCYRYTFSSKIECGICGSNYVHRISCNQKGKKYFYWSCYNKVTLKEKCPKSLTIREDILKEMFIEVYNSITTQKHKTRDRLIKAIKETITSEDNKKELSKLYSEVQTLQKRLSNLIDLKLDNIENKDVYNEKEEEISNKIKMLNEQIELLEYKDISKRLKDIEKIINEAAYILRKRKQFKGLEKLGVYAAKVDPFNEWEELIMEAMVETRRYDEAEELYTDVVDYYLRECGIYPSSRLLEILEKYSNQMNHAHEILENIQEGMNEQEETERGGYFCSYPVFRGIYQASIRIMKRTRVPVYLMLCTLEDEEGRQVQSETKMNKYSRQLKKCVGESIRYSDIYTSYGKVQFLIMLIGIKREDCEIVKKRINRQFAKKNPRAAEKCHVNSIVCEL